MAMKQSLWKIKGMLRDLSVSSFNSEFSYENKNIRILTTGENTSLALSNERGTKEIEIPDFLIEGVPIGQAVIDKQWIIFTTGEKDRIYKITEGTEFIGECLYEGDLNFDVQHPIETLPYYENEKVQKVYWTDGINQPRVINIAELNPQYNDYSFDFVQTMKLEEEVTIFREDIANGMFAPGSIQYCLSYYNQYNLLSSLFYISPLYYTSYTDRGASADNIVSTSFNIEIKNIDTSFQYLRIYSILRTSIDATPQCKIVIDIPISENTDDITYIDTGTSGSQVDYSELLYIGGEEATFKTMAQKNNTLFLGGITLKRKLVPDEVSNVLKGKEVTFKADKHLKIMESEDEHYGYKNLLTSNSQQIKTFKYLEWYRFGILFQHITGKWSEPVFLSDCKNTIPNGSTSNDLSEVSLVTAHYLLSSSIGNELLKNNYVKARPVIVYPSVTDRDCICQGIVCPTVFNINDRFNNTPFVISSWYARPNSGVSLSYLNLSAQKQDWNQQLGNPKTATNPTSRTVNSQTYYHNSLTGALWNGDLNWLTNSRAYKEGDLRGREEIDLFNRGSWVEFRHNKHLPFNSYINAEIQCMYDVYNKVIEDSKAKPALIDTRTEDDRNKVYTIDTSNIQTLATEKNNYFYVDKSIVTLHSPDIEFDSSIQSLDLSNYKFRIVGRVPLTSHQGDVDISTEGTVQVLQNGDLTYAPMGFYKESNEINNISLSGWKVLMGAPYWFDGYTKKKDKIANVEKEEIGYIVYPWNKEALTNFSQSEEITPVKIQYKKMSNLRYSICTEYLKSSAIWNSYKENDNNLTGVSDILLFNSDLETITKLKSPKNSSLSTLTYYGNVDKIVMPYIRSEINSEGYPIMIAEKEAKAVSRNELLLTKNGYHDCFAKSRWVPIGEKNMDDGSGESNFDLQKLFSKMPVRLRYKSSPHLVLAFNYTKDKKQRILPSLGNINRENEDTKGYALWNTDTLYATYLDNILPQNFTAYNTEDYKKVLNCGYLWIGEIYNDNVKNRFGGTSEEAIENNQWLPCGDGISIKKDTPTELVWNEGDTYYLRYDNLKTYPYSLEEKNGLVEIVSFMCETRINIDGRYDRNRGLSSNLAVSNTNFNRLNDVYSQQNNFFTYRTFNKNRVHNEEFPNSVTWTKTKNSGALIDSWTNITLASIENADLNKGRIRALRNYKDTLLIFLDKAIAQLLYNEQNQISTTEGVPIEIANSGKVQGIRYYSEQVGCTNKWSICETPNSLYFIDSLSKDLYSFGEGIKNVSQIKGFDSFFKSNLISQEEWNPLNNEFTLHYDKINKDLFIVNRDYCLAFSEALDEFSSFYDYLGTHYFGNLSNKLLLIHDNKLYLNNAGEYNYFYGEYKPYYITVIANLNPTLDKIFNQVEFRADMWKNNEFIRKTFDTIDTWNEYLLSHATLTDVLDKPSVLKLKFRIWRANIPRATYGKYLNDIFFNDMEIPDIPANESNTDINIQIPEVIETRDRMRNPWLYIKLSKQDNNNYKMVLQDIMVNYFEETNNYYNNNRDYGNN